MSKISISHPTTTLDQNITQFFNLNKCFRGGAPYDKSLYKYPIKIKFEVEINLLYLGSHKITSWFDRNDKWLYGKRILYSCKLEFVSIDRPDSDVFAKGGAFTYYFLNECDALLFNMWCERDL